MIIDDFYINYNTSFQTSRYLATGDAIIAMAYNFQICVSTARQISLVVCTAIGDVLVPIYICLYHQEINRNPLQMSSMTDGTFPIV